MASPDPVTWLLPPCGAGAGLVRQCAGCIRLGFFWPLNVYTGEGDTEPAVDLSSQLMAPLTPPERWGEAVPQVAEHPSMSHCSLKSHADFSSNASCCKMSSLFLSVFPIFKRFLLLCSYNQATLAAGMPCAFPPQLPLLSFCSGSWSHPSIQGSIMAATPCFRAWDVHGE